MVDEVFIMIRALINSSSVTRYARDTFSRRRRRTTFNPLTEGVFSYVEWARRTVEKPSRLFDLVKCVIPAIGDRQI